MAAIRNETSGIVKEKIKMGKFDMKAHTIEGVLHGMRALLNKYGVWMQPQLISREYNGNRCDVIFDFIFENVDDHTDVKTIRYAGAGTDNADKAFAKAGTNALKEMLKKVFLITDREDTKEEHERVEHREHEGATRSEVDQANDQAREAILRWAVNFKSLLDAAKSQKDIVRLERENKDQLTSDNLPAITRSFFVDLIEKRKSDLAEPAS